MIAVKKPIQIEAIIFEYSTIGIAELKSFVGDDLLSTNKDRHTYSKGEAVIKTLEGQHIAIEGDYIIKGIAGEFYPCKPDIFLATYDITKP